MNHVDIKDIESLFYWVGWTVLFAVSKVFGFFGMVTGIIVQVEMPVHTIKYLPQLSEAMPAFIIAGGCALISAIINKLFGLFWSKLFSKKPVKD